MDGIFNWILSAQRYLQGELAGRATELFESPADLIAGLGAALLLGLVHALTPGHGKSVMFAYFSGHRARPLSGLAMAAGAAATHGLLAVLLVVTLGRALGPLGRPTGATAWLEVISAALVAGIGAWYVLRLFIRRGAAHDHDHRPTRSTLAMAMGMLPCPLTIIVVGVAIRNGALAAGLVLAAAISVGAAVTIGAVGFIAMGLRRLGLAVSAGTRVLDRLMAVLELLSSVLILGLGVLSLIGALRRLS